MSTTLRILTVAGLLGALGIGGGLLLNGQSEQASAAVATADAQTDTATMPAMHFKHHGAKLEETAKLFGITTDELQKELQSGKPFYRIAAEHGLTYDKLKEQQKTDMKTRMDDMVKVGFMTQEQADEILNKTDELPMLGMGLGHRGGGGFGGMMGMMRMVE